MDQLDRTFAALADPTRRAILARLAQGEASVAELAEPFAISVRAVSLHVGVLQKAGLVMRSKDALFCDGFHCISGVSQDVRQNLSFGRVEVRQNKVSCILTSGRTSNADAHTIEFIGANGGNDVAQSVVTTVAAIALETNHIEIDIEFIMQNNQVGGFNAIEIQQVSYWTT